MSKIALSGNASGTGTFTIESPNTNTNYTLTLPESSGTVATTANVAALVPPGSVIWYAARVPPSGYLKADGTAVSRSTYAALFAAICPVIGTVTITIASPAVFTLNAHGLSNGDPVRLNTTGALPTGLNTTTTYFVISASTNTFQLSTTAGGSAINTSGTQSGTQTVQSYAFGVGDGSTTFNLPNLRGEFVRGWDDGRGVDSGRVFGSSQGQAIQAHTHDGFTALANVSGGGFAFGGGTTQLASVTASTGGTETRPRNVALLACIKF